MAMGGGPKLFHTLFLLFVWQFCGDVGATFNDITGAAEGAVHQPFSFRAFGSHGGDLQSPTEAPVQSPTAEFTIAPAGQLHTMLMDDGGFGIGVMKDTLRAAPDSETPKGGRVVVAKSLKMLKGDGASSVASPGAITKSLSNHGSAKNIGNIVVGSSFVAKSISSVGFSHGIQNENGIGKVVVSHGVKSLKTINNVVVSHGVKSAKSIDSVVVSHKSAKSISNVISHGVPNGVQTAKISGTSVSNGLGNV